MTAALTETKPRPKDPWLLTPGPLTTSLSVKEAMLRDLGSRDDEFIAINRRMRERLVELAGAEKTHVCVPLQGSGTFAVEAMLVTFLSRNTKVLILINGAYGERIAKICATADLPHAAIRWAEDQPVDPAALANALKADKGITHVAVVHCETTSGILNPLEEIAAETARHGRRLLIDSMSAFGALPVDGRRMAFEALVASSNKCIEGVPGFSYVLVRRQLLDESEGVCHSTVLDLFEQWTVLERTGQFRFTPPTHALVAFQKALEEFAREGGIAARAQRYQRNADVLVRGMREMGIQTLLSDDEAGPIIQTFLIPRDPNFKFETFYEMLRQKGYAIYPGKLTKRPSFRIGTIGQLDETVIRGALTAIREVLRDMNVADRHPLA